ncbi:MAG: hypothetical protein IT485_08955 [Gammaproteobacteria bacterium]|nr:hypothetical protein [Gammaproteobacteria bacterium]QOJ33032.1 MAG: hypothetical protein HRU81_13380 [Gammaproteobacteria bacterium]
MNKAFLALATLGLCGCLAACGLKGDLYLPPPREQASPPAAPAVPADPQAAPSQHQDEDQAPPVQ